VFNPQLDFGLKTEFKDKTYTINQWAAKVMRPSKTMFYPMMPFIDLRKGDIFIVLDKATSNRIEHKNESDIFKALSDPYRDELGILCIDFTTSIDNAELK